MPTQKFKICVGNHPDDVKKWIEERRKRFPRRSGTSNGAETHLSTFAGEKRDREESPETANDSKKQCIDREGTGTADSSANGAGALSSLLAGYDSSSSDEEKRTATTDKEPQNQDVEHNQNLSSTLEHTSVSLNASSTARVCKFFKRGKCRHGDSCKFLHTKSEDKGNNEDKRKAQSEQDKSRRKYESELQALGLVAPGQSNRNGHRPVNNTSLLNKLLQREKERERRLTLQLLRYIVDCDYFQGDNSSSMKDADESDSAAGERK